MTDRRRIVVLDPFDDEALDRLRAEHDVVVRLRPASDELRALVAGADALIVRSGVQLPGSLLAAAPRLRVIARAGSGVDNIDLDAARAAGIVVFNTPATSANAVAELALGLLLSVTRNIALGDRQLRAGKWNKAALAGVELTGRTLGVVGLGAIGGRLAELAAALPMPVLATVERAGPQRQVELAARGITLVALPQLLAEADVVALAVPLHERTRRLITSRELRLMKPGAFLLNIARGGVVDEDDLYAALVDGTIAGAAVDVFADEAGGTKLSTLDNVVLTPHLGAMSHDAQRRIGASVVDNLAAAFAGRPVTNRVC